MSRAERSSQVEGGDSFPVVDCDIHIPTDGDAVAERMPEPFRSKGVWGPGSGYSSPIGVTRRDAVPEGEETRFDLLCGQVLDPLGIEHGIITGGVGSGLVAYENRRHAVAVMRAYNDWVLDEWTSRDDRLHASIGLVPHAPEESAAEIRRLGDHPDMVQAISGTGTRIPIGQPEYWPVFEAAEEADIPVAMHIGPKGDVGIGHPNTPAGQSSNYTEGHIAQSINCYGQVASLVLEGVFEEFPDLTFVCIEGEFGWVPDLLWRMDRNWEALREEAPWLSRPPSEYVLDNVRFTTQPIPEPPRNEYFHDLLEMIHAGETLMFCTDYPHWDGDYSPRQVFPGLDDDLERAVFFETANELYGF
ncbi:MAG: amidohydrolase family protein [Haloarculaceae archaeon]